MWEVGSLWVWAGGCVCGGIDGFVGVHIYVCVGGGR